MYSSEGEITGPVKASVGTVTPTNQKIQSSIEKAAKNTAIVATAASPAQIKATEQQIQVQTSAIPTKANSTVALDSAIKWQLPTNGRIIQGFSNSDGGNKGIDIAGQKGQDIRAAAAGKVVYAGNALEGYGNLIIIKHNDDFLSAYAHNDRILVSEQDNVKAGQKIATMGSTGTSSNKLHFEIRYKGKSIDPTHYLPNQ